MLPVMNTRWLAQVSPPMATDGDQLTIISVLIGAGLFAAVMLVILWMISRSITSLRRGAARFAKGDLKQRVDVSGPLQVSALAESLNQMASQLEDRLSTVSRQRNELGAVLTSMIEGVLAIDPHGRVLSLNRAAAMLLRLDASQVIGRSIQEVVRNSALQTFVHDALQSDSAQQTEIVLRTFNTPDDQPLPEGRHIEVQSAILHDEASKRIGAVFVLHDVTSIRRLESMRRDFVANVSHEVKTPVSAIKASAETLLDDEGMALEDRQRFLAMIARQADRLDAIVDDLLSLARIEQGVEHHAIELRSGRLLPVLRAVLETCQSHADTKHIHLHLQCDADARALINESLLEQAIVNLVNNAIKYSPDNTNVLVISESLGRDVVLSVKDEGRGIAPEHLSRIFERFYRTDKARSRAMGGTGLGLSIVKHIAEAHGGRVSVESVIGQGSTFQIHLQGSES